MTNWLRYVAALLALFICAARPAQPQSCVAAPSGLVAWWPGDANENDIIGGHNPESVNAVTLVPGEARTGFTFGTEGYIEIPASAALANPEFTWAAWVRPDGPGPNNDQFGSVVVQQDLDNFNGISIWWRATDGRFSFYFGNINSVIYSTDTFAAGAFYFVSATYDGQTYQLFVNGLLEATLSAGLGTYSPSNPWMIGSTQPSFFPSDARTWNGVIDEVQAYNRALSLPEIQAIDTAGKAGVCKGLTFSAANLRFPRRTVGTTSPPKSVILTNAFPLPLKFEGSLTANINPGIVQPCGNGAVTCDSIGSAVYWNSNLFVWPQLEDVDWCPWNSTTGLFSCTPVVGSVPNDDVSPSGFPGGMLSLSANCRSGTNCTEPTADAVLWAIADPTGAKAYVEPDTDASHFRAKLKAYSLTQLPDFELLYVSTTQFLGSIFAPPTVVNGMVYVPTYDSGVLVFYPTTQ